MRADLGIAAATAMLLLARAPALAAPAWTEPEWSGRGELHQERTQGPDPCKIRPFDSVDNGMGAEPGVVREFGSAVAPPAQRRLGGLFWVPLLGVNLTRTSGPSSLDLSVFLRRPATSWTGRRRPRHSR
jgi:hypothetical protein